RGDGLLRHFCALIGAHGFRSLPGPRPCRLCELDRDVNFSAKTDCGQVMLEGPLWRWKGSHDLPVAGTKPAGRDDRFDGVEFLRADTHQGWGIASMARAAARWARFS